MAFIVFEGGEGVGKSTQIELLFTAIKQLGMNCILTREPGGTPFAESIRSLFKQVNDHNDTPLPLTELLLVSAARFQHIKKVVQPALQKDHFVLCDRFLDSTYVYQCILGNIQKEVVDNISNQILENLIPDLTFVFIADPNVAITRIQNEKKRQLDRMDSLQNKMHFLIKDGYLKVLQTPFSYPNGKVPKRVLINADLSIDKIFTEIKKSIFTHLGITI